MLHLNLLLWYLFIQMRHQSLIRPFEVQNPSRLFQVPQDDPGDFTVIRERQNPNDFVRFDLAFDLEDDLGVCFLDEFVVVPLDCAEKCTADLITAEEHMAAFLAIGFLYSDAIVQCHAFH